MRKPPAEWLKLVCPLVGVVIHLKAVRTPGLGYWGDSILGKCYREHWMRLVTYL